MAIIGTGLDPSMNLVQAINDEALPEHDALYEATKQTIENNREKETSEDTDAEIEETSSEETDVADGTDGSDSTDAEDTVSEEDGGPEALEEIDGKQTTEVTERIRSESYGVAALEAFDVGFDDTLTVKAGKHLANGLMAGGAVAASFSWTVLKELGGYLKEAGINYGPVILQRIKATVGLVAGRSLRLSLKLATASSLAYRRKKNSIEKTKARLVKMKQTVDLMMDQNTELSRTEPFNNQEYFDLFTVNGKPGSIKESTIAVAGLLGCLKSEIDAGIEHEVRVIENLIDNTRRGVRFSPIAYMKAPDIKGNYTKRSVEGYSSNPELIDTYVYKDALPMNTLLIFGLIKNQIVDEASRTLETEDVMKAYHSSFIVLGVNPLRPKSNPQVNYVEKDKLRYLLEMSIGLCDAALSHVSIYQSNVKRASRLKTSYQHYFAWLTGDEQQKALKESLAELIYLKQSFVTKVYLPAMLDIHDYTAVYLKTLSKFAEENIKAIRIVSKET